MTHHDDADRAGDDEAYDGAPADGAAEVAAAARARGMAGAPVRRDELRDGEVQHVVVEEPRDPAVAGIVVGALVLAAGLGAVGLVAGLFDATIVQGVAIGGALLLVATAMVLAATRMIPEELVVQQRHELSPPVTGAPAVESGAPAVDVGPVLGRRSVVAAALSALGAIGAALLVPARGVGPSAGDALRATAWADGVAVVDEDGEQIVADELPTNGIVTIWPADHVGDPQAQAVLVRIAPEFLTAATLAMGTSDGLLAYSKNCTHAGCAIAQFSADDRAPDVGHVMVCPCHQSVFDLTDRAAPAGGPATRPLSQLPVGVDQAGLVVARGDFDQPPGPAWWSR